MSATNTNSVREAIASKLDDIAVAAENHGLTLNDRWGGGRDIIVDLVCSYVRIRCPEVPPLSDEYIIDLMVPELRRRGVEITEVGADPAPIRCGCRATGFDETDGVARLCDALFSRGDVEGFSLQRYQGVYLAGVRRPGGVGPVASNADPAQAIVELIAKLEWERG